MASSESGGRLVYIEPNTINYNPNGVDTNDDTLINNPLEDYCIAVDLRVVIPDRMACGIGEGDTMEFTTNKGSISFINNGHNGYLTTSYTDISAVNQPNNDPEALGIKSIDISYTSWLYPQVEIDFVDIRGASIMEAEEDNLYNGEKNSRTSRFYKALTTFPYPLFTLKVKGFYGKGATFYLSPTDTKFSFDAESGNYNVHVSFIGSMFRIYADLPMPYISVAPYMEVGKEYWKQKIDDGTFQFTDGRRQETSPMITFPELRLRIARAALSEEGKSLAAASEKVKMDAEQKVKKLQALIDNFPFKDWLKVSNDKVTGLLAISGTTSEDTKWLGEAIDKYVAEVSAFTEAYPTDKYVDNFKTLALSGMKDEGYKKIKMIKFVRQANGKLEVQGNIFDELKAGITLDDFVNDNPEVKAKIEQFVKGQQPNVMTLYIVLTSYDAFVRKYEELEHKYKRHYGSKEHSYLTIFKLFYKEVKQYKTEDYTKLFEEIIPNQIKEIDKEKEKTLAEYKEAQNALIEKALGFKPTVRNMYNLAFAHMETFIETFKATLANIKRDIDSSKRPLSLITSESDIPKDYSAIPPFAAFFKQNKQGENKAKQFAWLEDIPNGYQLEEVKLVKDLLRACELYNEENDAVTAQIESWYTKNPDNTGGMLTSVRKFIPLTTYDFVNFNTMENPYAHLQKIINENDSSLVGSIVAAFAFRAFYYLDASNGYTDEAEAFGKLEAVNFKKGVKNAMGPRFIKFLVTFADGKGEWYEDYAFTNVLTRENDEGVAAAWHYDAPNVGKSLFKETGFGGLWGGLYDSTYGSWLGYNYHKSYYYPLGVSSLSEIKKAFATGDSLSGDTRFISMTPGRENFKYTNNDTFHIIEDSRDYIKGIFESIQQDSDLPANDGNSAVIKDKNKTLAEYQNNLSESLDGTVYKDIIYKVTGEEASKDEIKEALNGNAALQSNYVFKQTGLLNEDKDKSIFESKFYNIQTNDYAKAYIFINSLPINSAEKWLSDDGIQKESKNGVVLKSMLLREGSFWWRKQEMEDNKGDDKFIYKGTIWGLTVDYKQPAKNETFFNSYAGVQTFSIRTGAVANIANISPGYYTIWSPPEGTTESRKAKLIKYFKDWAIGEYKPMEEILKDKKIYNKKKDSDEEGTYSEGLNFKFVEGNNTDTSRTAMDARKAQTFLRSLYFGVCTTFDYYNGLGKNLTVHKTTLRHAFKGFMEGLNEIYGKAVEREKNSPGSMANEAALAAAADPFNSIDIRTSTYLTLKTLYDKWLASPYKGENTWKLGCEGSDFESYIYVDSFFQNIGSTVLTNATKIGEWIESSIPTVGTEAAEGQIKNNSKTVFHYINAVAEVTGGMLLTLPIKLGMQTIEDMRDMFKANSFLSDWEDDSSTYAFVLPYKRAEHLGNDQYGNDGFDAVDSNGTVLQDAGMVFADDFDSGQVPIFGVSYGRQNQSVFKNVSLSTETHSTTEQSVKAAFSIASKGSEAPRESVMFGQDLYKIFASYSYSCEFDMLGCMQVSPLMYFQLNNVALWHGVYQVQNITHHIEAGNMNTHVKGVKMSKYALPMAEGVTITSKPGATQGIDESTTGQTSISVGATIDAPVPTGDINTQADRSVKLIDKADFDEGNITSKKPVICLTPAHGPKTSKSSEWTWSSKLIDEFVIPKLKKLKFFDGTSYEKNIQRCNKGGKNTNEIGYNTKETQAIIRKYGSDSVISIVPHWNACAANYFHTYIGSDYDNNGVVKKRTDTANFAKYINAAAEKVKAASKSGSGKYALMPKGMMNGVIENAEFTGNKNSDGGCRLNCACPLLEIWFADYGDAKYWIENQKSLEKIQVKNEDGKFKIGAGWLLSKDGCDVISDLIVEGIQNYINSLR